MTDAIRETLIDILNKHRRGDMDTNTAIPEILRVFKPLENGAKEYKLDNS